MRLLLDTHIAVWIVEDNPALTKTARQLLTDKASAIFVSAAAIWEIAIKSALRPERQDAFGFTAQKAHEVFTASGMKMLDMTAQHAATISDLPAIHADPFDRMMIAQAHCENLHFMTHDRALTGYSSDIILV